MIFVGMPAVLGRLRLGVFEQATSLEEQLSREGARELANAAMSQGDARRGAVLFYQPHLQCATCHVKERRGDGLGPDLATLGENARGPRPSRRSSSLRRRSAKGMRPSLS